MDYQNVTLSLPKKLLLQAKHLAIERGSSLSGLLSGLLEEHVNKKDSYRKAKGRHMAMLDEFDLGTAGARNWMRSNLHDRDR